MKLATLTRYIVTDIRADGSKRVWNGSRFVKADDGKSYASQSSAQRAAKKAVNGGFVLGIVKVENYEI